MTSVMRFIRQIPPNSSVYSATTVASNPSTYAYEFIPAGPNPVGNYPTGYMVSSSSALQDAITNAGCPSHLLLRDLGKTVSVPIGCMNGNIGFFRMVQLIAPSPVSSFNSGNFGVLGEEAGPDSSTNFLSFYIPISIMGVGSAPIPLPAACQM